MTIENENKDVDAVQAGVSETECNNTECQQTEISDTDSGDSAKAGVSGEKAGVSGDDAEKLNIQKRVRRFGFAALILSMGILCSRLLGFVRDAVIAYQAGAGGQTDAYNAAFLLPDIMNHFLAGGTLSITFIPLFSAYLVKGDQKKADRLFSLIATTMGLLVLGSVILCGVFATPLVQLLFSEFSAEQIATTVEMTRIILPGQLFHYLGALMMAVLMARGQFLPSALAPLIYNASIILGGLSLGAGLGMEGFAIGAVVGAFLGPFLVSLLFMRKKVQYRPVISFMDADFRKYVYLTIPLILGVSLTTVDEWIGRVIGGHLGEGAISWLNYARRLVLVPIVLVGQAAGQAALPYLSQLAAKKDFAEIASTLNRTLKNVVILSMILMGFFLVLSEPMISLVYERGKFGAGDTLQAGMLLRILSVSIVFWTIQMVTVRVYYAAQSTWVPMILSTIATVCSLPVYYFLSDMYGLPGLAVASCIGMAFQALIVVLYYRRLNSNFSLIKLLKSCGIGVLGGALAAGGSYLGLQIVGQMGFESHTWKILFELGISGILGVIFVGVFARIIIPSEFKGFVAKVKRKVLRR